jgi:GT2 family glycosyltransferase
MNKPLVSSASAGKPPVIAGTAPRVSIIILNWNGFEVTKDCLESIEKIDYPSYQVVVVDNGSTDGSAERFQEQFPSVTVIRNEQNLGFTAGNNAGLRFVLQQHPDYVLLLNNDTIVSRDFLSQLVQAGEADRRIGVLNPKIYYEDPPDAIWYGGGSFSLWRGLSRHLNMGKRDSSRADAGGEVNFVTGCALLVKASVIDRIGLLDERFVSSFEDADFSIRAREAGFQAAYVPQARIWHRVSYTFKAKLGKSHRDFYNVRNSILIERKHARFYHWPSFLVCLGSYLAYRTGGYLLRGEFIRIRALYRGLWDGFSGPPYPHKASG